MVRVSAIHDLILNILYPHCHIIFKNSVNNIHYHLQYFWTIWRRHLRLRHGPMCWFINRKAISGGNLYGGVHESSAHEFVSSWFEKNVYLNQLWLWSYFVNEIMKMLVYQSLKISDITQAKRDEYVNYWHQLVMFLRYCSI